LALESDKKVISPKITDSDGCYEIFEKVCNDAYMSLERTKKTLSAEAMTDAARAISKSRRVVLIGLGSSAFEKVYPKYAHAGIEAAEHSHNLFLQIAVMMGIFGLVAFLIVLLLFTQKNMEYFRDVKDSSASSGVAISAFCSAVAALCMGMFDYIWYNNRIFFLFWAVVGLSCAAVRISDSLAERTEAEVVCDKRSAFIDI
jgi:hypothetical protein